ncbi:MAG: hypothetical protein MJ156_02950 [Alphaproteobacteria bacterium]|nr:hypothetical protein [Alphaproteobacteria bacterium]
MGLFMMFNKEYRQDEKLINTLASKFTDTKHIGVKHKGNTEIYDLDTLEIHFNLTTPKELKIMDGDEIIYTMNCEYDAYNEIQQHRAHLFSQLLDVARKQFEKQQKEIARKSEFEKSVAKIKADNEKKKSEEQARMLQIQNAINRIK